MGKKLYPPIEPFNTFYLNVSSIHTIFVEESGDPNGKPIIFLHDFFFFQIMEFDDPLPILGL